MMASALLGIGNTKYTYDKYQATKQNSNMIGWLLAGNIVGIGTSLALGIPSMCVDLGCSGEKMKDELVGDLLLPIGTLLINHVIINRVMIVKPPAWIMPVLHLLSHVIGWGNIFAATLVPIFAYSEIGPLIYTISTYALLANILYRILMNVTINLLTSRKVSKHVKLGIQIRKSQGPSTSATGFRLTRQETEVSKASFILNVILVSSILIELIAALCWIFRKVIPPPFSLVWSTAVGLHLVFESVFQYYLGLIIRQNNFGMNTSKITRVMVIEPVSFVDRK